MAKYRKDPLVFSVPSNMQRGGVSFVPFGGLEINDNPLLNTQSSASDMLNMVVDDNYFLTMRPRLLEDKDYSIARALVNAEYDEIMDVVYLKTGIYAFIARYYEDDDWFVVVENGKIYNVVELAEIRFDYPTFADYIIKQDSDAFRFTAIRGEHYSLILKWIDEENRWDLSEEEPYIPRYRAVITQPANLLEQPIFEDLNIMSNKYKLSVLYTEDGGVDLQSFYSSAIDVEGSPYYLDVDVAGVTEDGVAVAGDLIISQILYVSSSAGYVELYNGSQYSFPLNGLSLQVVGIPDSPIDFYYFLGGGYDFAPGETIILRSDTAPAIPGLTTYPHEIITAFISSRGTNGLKLTFQGTTIDFFGSQTLTPAIDPLFGYPTCLIRKPEVTKGGQGNPTVYNLNEWILTSTTSTADLGSHTMDDHIYGDGSFFGSGQRALCYEGSNYTLYYDYQDVFLKMSLGTVLFDVDIYRIDHATKINSLFTTLHVGGVDPNNRISLAAFKRLWNEDIIYDANSRIIYTLHYDAVSNKFIRANFNLDGGDLSIGTMRGGNYVDPKPTDYTPDDYWMTRYNDIVYYIPDSSGAEYYNTMDLDIPGDWLHVSNYFRNTNYFRNYYLDGMIFTVHSGTWGAELGVFTPPTITKTNLGLAMTATNLSTLKTIMIIGDTFEEDASKIHHQYTSGGYSYSFANKVFKIRPHIVSVPTLPNTLTYNYDYIKGIINDGLNYIVLSAVDLEKALNNEAFSQTRPSQSTFVYPITNDAFDLDNGFDLAETLGNTMNDLGQSRTIGIRNIYTQTLLFNYTYDDIVGKAYINKGRPFFYVMTNIGNAAKTINVGAVLKTWQMVEEATITASGNFRLFLSDLEGNDPMKVGIVNIERSIALSRASIGIFPFAEGIDITESTPLPDGTLTAIGTKDGYYYYGLIAVNKDEVVFTYSLVNNLSNPLRLDKELIADHKRRYDDWRRITFSADDDYDLKGAVDMSDSRLYYTRYRLYLTFPGKNNYIPLINCFDAKRPIRSATAYLQQVGAIYEENNVEYLSMEENPFVTDQYLMHSYIPRLLSVEQPAIDYIEGKTLVTFTGMTVYLSDGGLYALNFDAETPQDDQRKATLISRVVNPKLLKYDLNKALLANYDPYVLIMFPKDGETHVFAFKLSVNQWFFWKLPIEVSEISGDNFTLHLIYDDKMAIFNDEPIIIKSDISEYHGNVEQYMDFDEITIPWFWKSQILSMGNITRRKQITETIFTFVNNNANIILDEDDHFDIIERRVTNQAFGLRYLTFKDVVDIAPRIEYEQELNIINNLRKRTYLNRFNYCQLLCYNIDKENPIQDKVRIANIVIVYKMLTGGK